MGIVTAAETYWIEPFSGLPPRLFAKLVRQLVREGADVPRPGRPWSLPLADRVLLVAACWRTNLTLRQLAPFVRYLEVGCRPVSLGPSDTRIGWCGPVEDPVGAEPADHDYRQVTQLEGQERGTS